MRRALQERTYFVYMYGNVINEVGYKLFNEVVHTTYRFITALLADHSVMPPDIGRYLAAPGQCADERDNHEALCLGHEANYDTVPMVL